MKPRRHARITYLSPAAQGWRLRIGALDAPPQVLGTLEEAYALIPADHLLHWAVPTDVVLMERMRLPATDRGELGSMMHLQLEKTLPFAADEMTSDLEIISRTETESLIVACAVNNEQLDTLSLPLRGHQRVPEKITPFPMHVAAGCAADETVAVIYPEDGEVVLAISENGALGFAQTLSVKSPAEFFAELPQLLLSAELDGVLITFARVRLEKELSAWEANAREFFGVPVESFSLAEPLPEPQLNIVPPRWHRERERLSRATRLRSRLVLAGVAYLLMLLGAAGAIFWMRHRLSQLDRQAATSQPLIESIAAQKARWNALAPGIDPNRYVVEILRQMTNSLPPGDARITSFDQTTTQFTVETEAPNASVAVEFGDSLKKAPGLKDFSFMVNPPAILPNNRAQLHAVGKL